MKKVIHKYQLQGGGSSRNHFHADIPSNIFLELLDIGAHGIEFFVWAVRPAGTAWDEIVRHKFLIVATGEEFELPDDTYIFWKRVEMAGGAIQLHVYRSYKIEKVSP